MFCSSREDLNHGEHGDTGCHWHVAVRRRYAWSTVCRFASVLGVFTPLSLSLSLGGEGTFLTARVHAKCCAISPPLPPGEGWGEGISNRSHPAARGEGLQNPITSCHRGCAFLTSRTSSAPPRPRSWRWAGRLFPGCGCTGSARSWPRRAPGRRPVRRSIPR